MISADDRGRKDRLEQALTHLRTAIAICDELAESLPACYLQHALDLLDENAIEPSWALRSTH